MAVIERSREAEAFLDTRQHVAPEVLSACAGWTAHEVTAHLAAAAAEVTRHLRPYLAGEPVPPTQSFEERERPYRALADATLRERLDREEHIMRAAIAEVLDREPDAVIPWTGRRMAVAKFVPHLRNEFAVHRWDLVGDDDTSTELLAQPELTEHAVEVLGEILPRWGRAHDPEPGRELRVQLCADRAPDVELVVDADRAALRLTERDADTPRIELDAAARVLFIWGRRPERPDRIRSHLDQPTLARVQTLLSGY